MNLARNLKIAGFHVFLNTGALLLFLLLNNNEAAFALAQIYVLIVLPLAYIFLGYRYVPAEGSFSSRMVSLSIVSLIGIAVWSVCLCLYMMDDAAARAESAFLVLPSEIVWIFYGAYNLLLYVPLIILDFLSLNGERKLHGYEAAGGALLINFIPLVLMYLGAFIKKIRS